MNYTKARQLADNILAFIADQKYDGQDILHAAIACDFVGRQRMVEAIAGIIFGRHMHVNSQDGTDACKQCGLDLRNVIHLRVNENV